MSTGQTRVIVLLLILFVLEMVVQPNIKSWLQQASNTLKNGLNGAMFVGLSSPNNLTPPPTNNYGNSKGLVNPLSNGTCPSGTSAIRVSNGKLMCQFN